MIGRKEETGQPMENNVVVAGIGCSGNLVHLLEGDQPYGIHGIHGRSLPIALGVKMAQPALNVVVVAGDGDFLSIGGEHIAPQAARNLNICAVIMDNGVYGLTKGQSSPTTLEGAITSSTPFGKLEAKVNPLELYLTMGVSFIASGFSGQPRPRGSSFLRCSSPWLNGCAVTCSEGFHGIWPAPAGCLAARSLRIAAASSIKSLH